MTTYPSKKDQASYFTVIDGVTYIDSSLFQKFSSAILAIENELGDNPSGIHSSIKDRLNYIDGYGLYGVPIPDISQAVSLAHTQNTDTGTTNASFQIKSSSGVILKNKNTNDLSIRNATDTGYSDIFANNINCVAVQDQSGNYSSTPQNIYSSIQLKHNQNTDSYTVNISFQLNTIGVKLEDAYSSSAIKFLQNDNTLADAYVRNIYATNLYGTVNAGTFDGYDISSFVLVGSDYYQPKNNNLTSLSSLVTSNGDLILCVGPNQFMVGKLTDGYVQSLSQNKTHDNADTDTSTSAIHHTLGTTHFQAAFGDHNHDSYYQPLNNNLSSISSLNVNTGQVILGEGSNKFIAGQITDGYVLSLSQNKTHDNNDVDSDPSALHHTLGTSSNQAASGTHTHDLSGYQPLNAKLTAISGLSIVGNDLILGTGVDTFTSGKLTDNYVQSISQSKSHDNPDTDAYTTSLHHTLGTSHLQAASGDHLHDSYYQRITTSLSSIVNIIPQNGQLLLGNDSGIFVAGKLNDGYVLSLSQNKTHDNPDTDSSTTSLHHTLGTGANQAAAGNDSRFHIQNTDSYTTNSSFGIGDVTLYSGNQLSIKNNDGYVDLHIRNLYLGKSPEDYFIYANNQDIPSYIKFNNTTKIWQLKNDGYEEVPINFNPSGEPIGFENRTDSYMSFNNSTRTFSIKPNLPSTSFVVWDGLVKYTKTIQEDIVISNSVGKHYIYYINGQLQESLLPKEFNNTLVSMVYWDGYKSFGITDERHGYTINWGTQKYLHQSFGMTYFTGFTLAQLTNTGGTVDTDSQISITNGTVLDQDINIEVVRSASPTNYFEQELGLATTIPGKFRIYYRNGTGSGNWTYLEPTTFPCTPWDGYVSDRIGYNFDNAGTWSIADPGSDGYYIAYFIIATNHVENPIISVMGQRFDAELLSSETNNIWTSVALADFPFDEFKPLYALIIKTDSTFSNNIKASISSIQDIRSLINISSTSYSATIHSNLIGLSAPNSHPATAISTDTSNFNNILSPSDTDVQLALDTLDDHNHNSLYQPLDATLTGLSTINTSAGQVILTTGTDSFISGKVSDAYVSSLSQNKTHDNADTDTSTSSIHHTLGTSSTQASAGDHKHDSYYQPLDITLTNLSNISINAGELILGSGVDSFISGKLTDGYVSSLSQNKTHDNVDTDTSISSIHHTLGTGANQALPGNDPRLHYQNTDSYTTSNTFQLGYPSGIILENGIQGFNVKNSTNDAYADAFVKSIYIGGGPNNDQNSYIYANDCLINSPHSSFIVFNIVTRQWEIKNDGYLQMPINFDPAGSPIGFQKVESVVDSYIWVDNSIRTFYISPKSPYTSYIVWQGMRYDIINTIKSIQFSNTKGVHYIYFNNGELNEALDSLSFSYPWVSNFYWDGYKNLGVSDQRHGTSLNPALFEYLHTTIGTRYGSGFGLTQLSSGTGGADTDCQISVDDGTIYDEDIKIDIIRTQNPLNPFEQELGLDSTIPALVPIFYRLGSDTSNWTSDAYNTFVARPWNGVLGSRVGYNLNTSGTWSVADPGNGVRIAMWIVATNSQINPVISIMGQRFDANLVDAKNNNAWETMLFDALPLQPMKLLYRLIVRTGAGFTNTIKAYIEDIQDLRGVSSLIGGTYVSTDHNSLSGRSASDSHPATAISTDTTNFNNILSASNTDVQSALDTLDGHTHAHSSLTGLSADDHTQYVHNTIARTITANHTFNNSTFGGPPFTIGVSSSDVFVAGLNADKLDGFDANQFVLGSDPRLHTQNTDTGTTNSTFQIQSGVKLKNLSNNLGIRTPNDDGYSNLYAADAYFGRGTASDVYIYPNVPNNTSYIKFNYSTQQWEIKNDGYLNVPINYNPSGEPIGFENTTDSYISFNNSNRVFTIKPNAPSTSFSFWNGLIKTTKTQTESITISNTIGHHYIYYISGQLQEFTAFQDVNKVFIASIYWDGYKSLGLFDERHGIAMDWATHKYLDLSMGLSYINGFDITKLSSGTGTSNTDCQISLTNGEISDEDIFYDIIRSSNPVNYFEQELGLTNTIPGNFPIYYRNGSGNNNWAVLSPTTYPCYPYNGTLGNRIGYNKQDGYGVWSISDPGTDGYYIAMYVLATNNTTNPIALLMGQRYDVGILYSQYYNTFISLSLGDFIFDEYKLLYILYIKTSTLYSNTIKAYIDTYNDFRPLSTPNTNLTTLIHSNLIGLDASNSHPATAISTNTSNFNSILSSSDINVQLALDTLDNHLHDAYYQPLNTNLTGLSTLSSTSGQVILASGNNQFTSGKISDAYVSSLSENKTHDNADTDVSDLAIHHTLGEGEFQASKGNHNHDGYYQPLDNTLTSLSGLSSIAGQVILSSGPDSFIMGQISDAYVTSLSENKTHDNADTDVSDLAIHHTLGEGQFQASKGNHNHDGYYQPLDNTLTSLSGLSSSAGQVILSSGPDSFIMGQISDAYVTSLSENKTHDNADTDVSPSAIHHTLGTGANQSAAGNDPRFHYQNTDSYTTNSSFGIGDIILYSGNQLSIKNNDGYVDLHANNIYLGNGNADSYIYSNDPIINSYIKYNYLDSRWEIRNNENYVDIPINFNPSGEPTGFENTTDSYMTFDDSTRLFTIYPKAPATQFHIWYGLNKFTVSQPLSYIVLDTPGQHFLYYVNGQIEEFNSFIFTLPIMTMIYWDGYTSFGITEERHGLTMDSATHGYLHNIISTAYGGGLILEQLTGGFGTVDTDCQISLTNGRVRDEDLVINITRTPTPVNYFEQEIGLGSSVAGKFPIYYRLGSGSTNWFSFTATDFPVYPWDGYVGSRIGYNFFDGVNWTIADQGFDGYYIAYFILATNNVTNPVISVMGQRYDTTLNAAISSNSWLSVSLGTFPYVELKPLYILIIKTDSTYANNIKAYIASVQDTRTSFTNSAQVLSVTNHANLTGLTAPNAHPATAISTSTINFNNILNISDTDVQSALDTLDDHTHASLYQPLSSALTGLSSISTSSGDVILETGTNTFISGKISDAYVSSLSQNKTHDNVDTDVSSSSIHHTLGIGQNQAAHGNHNHDSYYQPLDGTLTSLASLSTSNGQIILSTGIDSFIMGKVTDGYVSSLSQNKTHDNVDTDSYVTSIHHTLGTGQYQAAPGNHNHIHANLLNLTTSDDHTQYVHNTIARTITANHTFNNSGAPFTIGSNSYYNNVLGLNADRVDGYDAYQFVLQTDPRLHYQNTDTGTTSQTFQLQSGSSGVVLSNSVGSLLVRDSTNSNYASIYSKDAYIGTGSSYSYIYANTPDISSVNNSYLRFNYLNKQWEVKNDGYLNVPINFNPSGEPIGFENITDSYITFLDAYRTFTVQAKSPATSFNIWNGLYKFARTYDSVVIANIVGLHYIYYDFSVITNPVLTDTMVRPLDNTVTVGTIHWNGTNDLGTYDERHGIAMDWGTHQFIHNTIGLRYGSGLTAARLTTGTGAVDTDAQISITNGTINDEDLQFNIVRSATPSNPFEQELGLGTTTPGKFPIYYRNGSGADNWAVFPTTNFPCVTSDGTSATRLAYNLDSSGTWSISQVPNNNFFAMWIYSTNNKDNPIIAIMGQRIDTSLANAQANALPESLAFGNFFTPEFKLLYRLIYTTNLSFANTVNAYIADVQDYRNVNNLPAGTYVASAHSSLTGLTNTNSHPASAISTVTTNFNTILTASETTVQLALDKIDDHTHAQLHNQNTDSYTTSSTFGINYQIKLKADASPSLLFRNYTDDGYVRAIGYLRGASSTGSPSTSPLKLYSGTLLSIPEPGAEEYDGYFYYTGANGIRNLLSTYTSIIPASSTSSGKKGQFTADGYFAYICYSDNLWIRISKDGSWV